MRNRGPVPKLPRRSAVGEDLFIVRVRRDTTSRAELRGCVDLVATGERFYFTNVDDLTAFLRTRLAGTPTERNLQ